MAEPYLSRLQALIARLNVHAKDARDISCKHFFGGAAAYVDSRIFMTLTPAGLALKLSEQDCAALFQAHQPRPQRLTLHGSHTTRLLTGQQAYHSPAPPPM